MMRSKAKKIHAVLAVLLLSGWAAAGEVTKPPRTPRPTRKERQAVYRHAAGLRALDPAKVRAAVEGLAGTHSRLAAPFLWQLYARGDGTQRSWALEALGRLGIKGQEKSFFEAALSDGLLALRRAAADILARIEGRPAATRRFINALQNAAPPKLTPNGRRRAVQLTAHLGGPGAGACLKALLKDRDNDVAAAACEGLATLRDWRNAPALIGILRTKNLEVRPAAADALEQLSGKKYRFNLVRWEAWLAERQAAQAEAAKAAKRPKTPDPKASPGEEEDTYEPDYRDPLAQPVSASAVDFVVIFDTTGSMLHIWPEASAAIDAVLGAMVKKTPSLRLGSIRYRADDARRTLTYQILPKPLTRQLAEAREAILDASFGGGSGGLHLGIQHAVTVFNWRANARKVVLVVGDTTPRGSGLARCVRMIRDAWKHDHIQFNTLYIRSLHGAQHKSTYRLLAKIGAGRFYEYNKAWSHLVDLSAPKPNVKEPELAAVTLKKWLTPLVRQAPAPKAPPAPKTPKTPKIQKAPRKKTVKIQKRKEKVEREK